MSYINTITTDVLNPVVPANTISICIWPDGSWCVAPQVINHLGNSYITKQVDQNTSDEEIEALVNFYINN